MSDNVHVAPGDNQGETASALLAAAAELDLDPSVVQLDTAAGGFTVPEEVAKRAKADTFDPDEAMTLEVADAVGGSAGVEEDGQAAVGNVDQGPTQADGEPNKLAEDPGAGKSVDTSQSAKPAKKAAAKRPARKRAPAKKAAAKKTTASAKKES